MIHQFDCPGTILHGGGARQRLPELIGFLRAQHILIVTDPGVVALGVVKEMESLLHKAGLETTVFDDVHPDPTVDNVTAGVRALEKSGADLILAVGGGSPIDTAKVIAVVPENPGQLSDFMGLHKITRPGVPVIAVPTTAGTGSEATKVAVITDTEHAVKMMMLSRPLLPAAAVVDYELTLTMPQALTAAVGVDTLTHGLEAYVSAKANAQTDPLALSCIQLVSKHLLRAWTDPNDRPAREGMMLAACQGGMAFSNSSVCLVHGMSRPIGALFHLPHGLSNAVLLPAVTRFSITEGTARYAAAARCAGCADNTDTDAAAAGKLVSWLEQLNQALGVPRLQECRGVDAERFEEHLQKMAEDALASGSPANNPRVPTADEIVQIYRDAW